MLRKPLVYSTVAIVVGLLLVLVPLITVVGTGSENHNGTLESFSRGLQGLDGSTSGSSKSSTSDVESLVLSFVIAIVAFMFFRRRRPNDELGAFGSLPY